MKWTADRVESILAEVARWATKRSDISAVALVGSWARGTAHAGSDIDLVLLTPDPLWFRQNDRWLKEIDWRSMGSTIATWRDADYGVVWSRHLQLADGSEIEFGFGPPAWASVDPIDPGTFQVISDGCRVLYDPQGLLQELVRHVQSCLTTFSMVARCPQSGELGVAVSTAVPAVGAINPFAKAQVGAVATQAWSNPYLGIDGLRLLAGGLSAVEVLERLLKADADRERRQLSIVDAHGGVAAFTGNAVQPWKGHCEGQGYVVAGNLLVSEETILAMAESFEATPGPLAERLMAALEAGQAAGGDRRGKVSAALLVVGDEEYPHLDLRVDEHPNPVAELRRIFDLYMALPYLDDLHPKRTWHQEGGNHGFVERDAQAASEHTRRPE